MFTDNMLAIVQRLQNGRPVTVGSLALADTLEDHIRAHRMGWLKRKRTDDGKYRLFLR